MGIKSRIRPDYLDFRPLHDDAVHWVNDLILDLKLQMLGEQPRKPIDMTRLEQWQRYARDLEQCKERVRWY